MQIQNKMKKEQQQQQPNEFRVNYLTQTISGSIMVENAKLTNQHEKQ